jgi:atypical dual specificity phosphatase
MCWEYSGPIEDYQRHGISQLHLPTLDIQEPTMEDLKKAVAFIDNIHSQPRNKDEKKVVLIHCKGGRGRAVITCLCYLLSKGYSIRDGFHLIKSKRPVASSAVMYSTVVKNFERFCNN